VIISIVNLYTAIAVGVSTTHWMMAAKQVKKIVNSLSCPICNKLFKKPKFLPCHHSYCEQCLEKMKEESRITCPEFIKEAIVPAGVKEFDNAFITMINQMVDQLVLKCTVEDELEVQCDECFKDKPIKAFCPDCTSAIAVLTTTHIVTNSMIII